MSGHDLSLLRYYVKKSFGRVLRIGQSHSKQLVGNLANMFWAEASSAGQLARSYGLETKSLIVVTCLINISPSEGSTIKHRMVVVPRQYLETLPSVDTVDAPMGMDKDEFCEWMKVLEDIARVFKEEGKHSRSCRVNELVVRV
ncbi:MAG TPA: hypothetical protein VLK22_04610 [Candidatus Udaeobacter sp.]|nr:hypothetical protein [Candidatus Udaeobacter sp.]